MTTEKVSELKRELCNYLIQHNLVKPGDMIVHSYTNNRLNNIRPINTIQNTNNEISATLTTRPDTLGICVEYEEKIPSSKIEEL